MGYTGWLKVFGSFRFLAAVILSSAFLTSIAFTAAPEYRANDDMYNSIQGFADNKASRSPLP